MTRQNFLSLKSKNNLKYIRNEPILLLLKFKIKSNLSVSSKYSSLRQFVKCSQSKEQHLKEEGMGTKTGCFRE